jgi:hypothetical protein
VRGASEAGIVAVACHDEPDLGEVAEGVQVLRAPFAEPADRWEGARDKSRKRRLVGAWLREGSCRRCDVRDVPRRRRPRPPEIVENVLADGNGSYLIDHGYVFDLAQGSALAPKASVYRTCGSSFVVRFTRGELPSSWEDFASPFGQLGTSPDQRRHPDYDQVAAELGRPPSAFLFPAVVYTVNHSESLWAAKFGWTSKRQLLRHGLAASHSPAPPRGVRRN